MIEIPGWMSDAELDWLERVSRNMASVAEVGCWKGRGTNALLTGCLGPVYAVDHWLGSEGERQFAHREVAEGHVFDEFRGNVGHFPNLRIRQGYSTEVAPTLPLVDMTFIDAGHTYEEVKADIAAWAPRTLKLISGHDYSDMPNNGGRALPGMFPGVKRAVDEAFGRRVRRVPGTLIWYVNVPTPRKLMMATPAYGGLVMAGFTLSLINTIEHLKSYGIAYNWVHRSNDSLVPRSRIGLFANFLDDKDATHLLFIDGDLRWDAEHVVHLMRWDKPIVGGVYPMKTCPLKFPFNALAAETDIDMETGCFPIKDLPTGFMMIRRDAAERLIEVYGVDRRCRIGSGGWDEPVNRSTYDMFPTMIDSDGMYLSEDFAFCRLWQAIGGTVWCDPHIEFGHSGTHEFVGKLSDHLTMKEEQEPELAETC